MKRATKKINDKKRKQVAQTFWHRTEFAKLHQEITDLRKFAYRATGDKVTLEWANKFKDWVEKLKVWFEKEQAALQKQQAALQVVLQNEQTAQRKLIEMLMSRTSKCECMPDRIDALTTKHDVLQAKVKELESKFAALASDMEAGFNNQRADMDRFEHARRTTADRLDLVTRNKS